MFLYISDNQSAGKQMCYNNFFFCILGRNNIFDHIHRSVILLHSVISALCTLFLLMNGWPLLFIYTYIHTYFCSHWASIHIHSSIFTYLSMLQLQQKEGIKNMHKSFMHWLFTCCNAGNSQWRNTVDWISWYDQIGWILPLQQQQLVSFIY